MLLDSIFNMTRKPDEVIITDGGSNDNTREIVRAFIEKGNPVKLVCVEHAFPGKGRNLGAQEASYDIIAFTDAGIKLDVKWLENLILPIENDNTIDAVFGNYDPITDTWFKECASFAYAGHRVPVKGGLMRHNFVASSLVKKKVWEEVGGFPDFRAAEDRIFIEKIKNGNYKIEYAPQAIVNWEIPPDIKSTFARFYLYSYHDIIAGKAKDWHYAVTRMYVIALFIVVSGLLHNQLWLILLPVGFYLRVLKLAVRKRHEFKMKIVFNPFRVAMVSIIMVAIDVAMFAGIGKWLANFHFMNNEK